jgi:hypothetical protein
VRVITRLDETCREVRDAARVIGDADLFTKMEEAQALIKRDSELFALLIGCWADWCSCVCCQFVSIIIWLKRNLGSEVKRGLGIEVKRNLGIEVETYHLEREYHQQYKQYTCNRMNTWHQTSRANE